MDESRKNERIFFVGRYWLEKDGSMMRYRETVRKGLTFDEADRLTDELNEKEGHVVQKNGQFGAKNGSFVHLVGATEGEDQYKEGEDVPNRGKKDDLAEMLKVLLERKAMNDITDEEIIEACDWMNEHYPAVVADDARVLRMIGRGEIQVVEEGEVLDKLRGLVKLDDLDLVKRAAIDLGENPPRIRAAMYRKVMQGKASVSDRREERKEISEVELVY
jgi:hypothetical protein